MSRRLQPPWEPVEPPTPRAPAPQPPSSLRVQGRRHRQDLRGILGAPGALGEGPDGASFAAALAAAVQDGTQQRGRLTLLRDSEGAPAPRVEAGDRAALVTLTASGTRITDRRRVH